LEGHLTVDPGPDAVTAVADRRPPLRRLKWPEITPLLVSPPFRGLREQDSRQPRLDRRPPLELPQTFERAGERLLNYVLGVRGVAHQRHRQAVEPLGMAVDQRVKRAAVALGGLAQQLDVVRLRAVVRHWRRPRRKDSCKR